MRPFAVVEGMLIVSLAVALIAKPQPRQLSAAAQFPTPVTKTFLGREKKMGEGAVRSFVRSVDGKPSAVGITFPESALRGLPKTGDRPGTCCSNEIVLDLPIALPPFDHVAINWNPHGHEPAGIYDKPHFDVHFYMIDRKTRLNIDANDVLLAKAPPADRVPQGYVPTPGVMKMGTHWVDPMSPEFHGQLFTKTFLYGAYDGKVTSIEPMITKAFLESKPNVNESVKQPAAYPFGSFPTSYTVKYDEEKGEYTVALEGLERH